MLPIDMLSSEAEALLTERGYRPEALTAVLRLDLLPDGGEGETFLALDGGAGLLLRAVPATDTLEIFPLADYRRPYVDSLLSTCRLLASYTPPDGEEYTVGLGYATNACKSRLFIFVSVLEAAARGERLTGEEPMFDPLSGRGEAPPQRPRGMLRRTASLFLPTKGVVLLTLLFLLVEIASDLIRPYLSGKILFDQVIAADGRHHTLPALFFCLGVTVALAVLRWVAITARGLVLSKNMNATCERVQRRMYRRLQSMSLSYFNRTAVGRLMRGQTADVAAVRTFFGAHTASLIIYTVEFLAVGVLLFLLNWRLSLFILIPIPLIVLIYRRAFPHLRRLNVRANREENAVAARINDSLTGIRVVKAFSKEGEESELLAKRLERLYRVNLRANLFSALLGPTVALLIYFAHQAIWGVGGMYVIDGVLTYGDFCTYLGYVGMVFAPLQFFSNYTMTVGQAAESASRIINLLEAEPEVGEAPDAVTLSEVGGRIEFSDVRFHYVPNRPILRGVSFTIEPGDHVGLVGHTGSGKSTIANLLLRMYDVTGGSIRVDGVDVRRLSFATLRRSIAIVSQEIHVFIGTVAENIRFGRPTATDEEVIAAARAAGAHEFILALPDGYETVVGIGGRTLSGGERQRLSIARAILMSPSILILDEATAAMDNETERRIATALEALTRGRTTISIAHRLSTLRDCNKIMSLDGGRIAEMGTREELLGRDGIFARLYRLQNDQMMRVLKGEDDEEQA